MTIVIGFVPTAEGRAALRVAADEAILRQQRLVVLATRATEQPTTTSAQAAREHARNVEVARSEIEEELENALTGIRDDLDNANTPLELRVVVPGGEPSEEILEAAKEVDADFIVIGMRRRSPVGKLLLGSNAQQILLEAPCPVIAVHATSEE